MANNIFIVFIMFYMYLNASQYDDTLISFTLYSCLNACFIF